LKDCASTHSNALVVLYIASILTCTYAGVSLYFPVYVQNCVELIESVTITTKCLKDSFNRSICICKRSSSCLSRFILDTHWTGEWIVSEPIWIDVKEKNPCSCRELSPGHPVCIVPYCMKSPCNMD
jgi:hypothetical protein